MHYNQHFNQKLEDKKEEILGKNNQLRREKFLNKVRHRYDPDVSNVGLNFKIILTNMLRDPVEKMGNVPEQMGDFN